MRNYLTLTLLAATLFSCTQKQDSKASAEQQSQPVKNNITVPAEMKQKPDGTLYFKESYLNDKSSKDIDVIVTGDKIDTLK
ncbi:hypothetical protein [Pedobacter mendelii]|uniref:Uncharacterized protein n=1 Tax=Pedobacter mendelii TaxID=1908240 RepID=A0ABQ2BLK0_9SPHI|nr:hypothetical protein [Pedobacter mendelii]GGI29062.1 hypothetical protein GCM10008119_35760 [Pedobacter mendelii]